MIGGIELALDSRVTTVGVERDKVDTDIRLVPTARPVHPHPHVGETIAVRPVGEQGSPDEALKTLALLVLTRRLTSDGFQGLGYRHLCPPHDSV